MAEQAWSETTHELNKRIKIMIQKKVFSQTVGRNLQTKIEINCCNSMNF